MAWNEPGNNGKNNDPWKQGGRNQGPPDLDEVLRNLSKKLGGIFGGNNNSSPSESNGGAAGLVFVLPASALVWAEVSVFTLSKNLSEPLCCA
ncbi:MAG: protease modulator HflK N-terminal domain-containing protein [Rheinheimera sp.]|nr:protease modulator HflK N-terminal domain-containing protein [Rheinheimera sp.]